jgi:Na+/H+-dicarboxylate symporter
MQTLLSVLRIYLALAWLAFFIAWCDLFAAVGYSQKQHAINYIQFLYAGLVTAAFVFTPTFLYFYLKKKSSQPVLPTSLRGAADR